MSPKISIIIPSYNEATNIRLWSLDKVSRYLEHAKFTWEVIVVDDGSVDDTPGLLDIFAKSNPGFSIIHNSHTGKAGTVIRGVSEAKGDIVLFSDLDQATPISEIEKLLPWFTKGKDVVIGSRKSQREGAPLSRIIMARGFMTLRSLFLGLHGITDTQCGFKAFKRNVIMVIVEKLQLYGSPHVAHGPMVTAGFDIEVLYIAKKLGYHIQEVPVEWHYVETRRVNPIKDSWEGLRDILHIRWNSLRGKYS